MYCSVDECNFMSFAIALCKKRIRSKRQSTAWEESSKHLWRLGCHQQNALLSLQDCLSHATVCAPHVQAVATMLPKGSPTLQRMQTMPLQLQCLWRRKS